MESRGAQDRDTPRFLRLAADPATRARLRKGEILAVAAKTLGLQPAISIPGAQVQHWIGAAFIPDMTIARALPRLQDYDNRKRDMAPVIVDSRILSRDGDRFQVWLRLRQKEMISAIFDLVLRITYRAVSPGRLSIESRSESVQEVPTLDAPRGTPTHDRGFLWALNHYWRFAEQDGGIDVECEALVLARQTPLLLRWPVDPLVARAARRTLEGTLQDTVRMVRSRPAE